ncbi:DUF4395 family protein [Uliginosibacterium sp. 31-16]|uniref:DUF4395 family protein n=1 Tax=Uliginosibacterium sp. 31-16 TaxID=3068315 RepID=UPI00273F3AD9|nr:DUF4395 family protein [Uliginosibacterium sp. 31-16]MDP5240981.1 DUF4395 family protein [Uliginosibacterium sp. 31-16]
MLRFDVPPVWSNAARLDGLTTFAICAAALLGFPYLVPVLMVQGLVRGFFGHSRCPSHRLYTALLQKLGAAGKKENAGAKMFANKLLFIASTVATGLYLAGSGMWVVPVSVLLVFSFLEAAASFCAACWAYTLWYQLRGQN